MAKFFIIGGKPLEGEVALSGAKNAATKMMVASLLTEEECVFENFPQIGDVEITAELCRALGSEIEINGDVLRIKTPKIIQSKIQSLSRRNRIPILTLGPLLARCGYAEVPFVGGDKIGARPVDLHIKALTSLGAVVEASETSYKAHAPNGLTGAKITFAFPSVGATENLLFAAVLAKGKTTLYNAAVEPEILDLIKFLQKMGAIVELGTNRAIYIEGVSALHGARHRIIPDRNEAVSFASIALATRGGIFVRNAAQDHLITFLNIVRRIGGEYEVREDGILFWREKPLRSIHIETDTHPGFMTDWQQPLAVVLTQANGMSAVHETIYEDRFGYTKDLNLMGADIKVFSKCLGELPCRFSNEAFQHSAVISGPTKLRGEKLIVRDLRSGMAHVIAALVAQGQTIIEGIEEIDRGYEKIDERLRMLGAEIKRVN